MTNKCLAITGPFVPANEPMTLLSYKYLRSINIQTDVVALKLEADNSLYNKLLKDDKYQNFNVNYVGAYNDALFSIKNVNLFKALYHMHKYLHQAEKAFNKEYNIIYTSSFPAYVHRAGLKIKQNNKDVVWIASFSDPINNSPYKNDQRTYNEYSIIEKIAFKTYCKYYVDDNDEIIALENADILIFICEEQRDFMLQQYAKKGGTLTNSELLAKSVIFPLNYIKEWNDIIKVDTFKNETYTFAHFGRVYGLRDATEFIYAVSELKEHENFGNFKVKQFGEFRKSDQKLIKKLRLENYFEIHNKIPYERCIDEMNKADCLLIFDTILPDNEIQPYLPSKVLEYSLLKKDTLTITCRNSPCYRIARNSNAIVALNERKMIKEALMSALKGKKSILNYDYSNEDAGKELKNMLIKKGIL